MTPKVNRREALGALGLVGAAAAITAASAPAPARASHVELGGSPGGRACRGR